MATEETKEATEVKEAPLLIKDDATEAAAFADNVRIATEAERIATVKVREETALTKTAADTAAASAVEKAKYAASQGGFRKSTS